MLDQDKSSIETKQLNHCGGAKYQMKPDLLKSQGNQSLLGDEWLSSLHPLTGRDVASQERS